MVTLGYPSLHGDSHRPGWPQGPLLFCWARFLPGKNTHTEGMVLKSEGKQPKTASRSLWNWTKLDPFFQKINKRSCKGDSATRPSDWDKQKTIKLLWGGLGLSLGKNTLNFLSCLWAALCALASQLFWDITHTRVGFGDSAVCESFLLLKVTQIKLIVSTTWSLVTFII